MIFEENKFNPENLVSTLQQALQKEVPYGEKRRGAVLEDSSVSAAVLALFAYSKTSSSPYLLFMQRTETGDHHKGQISFPGGKTEKVNGVLETPGMNALRETEEEVGIPREMVQIIGTLAPLTTVTGFRVTPVVGILRRAWEDTPLVCQIEETLEAFWVSVSHLCETGVYRDETFQVGDLRYPIQVFQARDVLGTERRIWGATASILKNLLDRLA